MIHFILIHVTILLILAFFVLFAASKADGLVRLLGYVLGAWLLIAAAFQVVAGFVPGLAGMRAEHEGMMREHWMHRWGEPEPAPSTLPTQVPAQPAPPTPKKS